MSPCRGERVPVPPAGQWEVRFGTNAAAARWEEVCRHALPNTRRCLETLRTDPRVEPATTVSTGSAATWPRTGTTAATWSSESTRSLVAAASAT